MCGTSVTAERTARSPEATSVTNKRAAAHNAARFAALPSRSRGRRPRSVARDGEHNLAANGSLRLASPPPCRVVAEGAGLVHLPINRISQPSAGEARVRLHNVGRVDARVPPRVVCPGSLDGTCPTVRQSGSGRRDAPAHRWACLRESGAPWPHRGRTRRVQLIPTKVKRAGWTRGSLRAWFVLSRFSLDGTCLTVRQSGSGRRDAPAHRWNPAMRSVKHALVRLGVPLSGLDKRSIQQVTNFPRERLVRIGL